MQTATKRGSPPRARRGASPHFFGGSPAGAPARQAGGFGVWGRALPAPPAPGPSRQVPHGGKGCAVRRWGKRAGAARGKKAGRRRTGQNRARGTGSGRQVRHGKKGARCGTGKKAGRCGTGEKAGRCARGKKGARCGAGEKGRCGAGSGRPFVSREKVPKGPAGPAPSPSRQQGRAGKKGKGGISLFPRPWRPRRLRRGRGRRRCGGGAGCAAGAKQALRGFLEEGCPEGASGRKKKGGAGGGNPPPALSPFLFAAPLGRRRTFFGTFCGALPTHKSIGRVRTRRRCRRRDFAGRPPRCRPRGRWSGGCRQRGARPPR